MATAKKTATKKKNSPTRDQTEPSPPSQPPTTPDTIEPLEGAPTAVSDIVDMDGHKQMKVIHSLTGERMLPCATTIKTLTYLAKVWAEAARTGGMKQDKNCKGWQAYFTKMLAGLEIGIPPAAAVDNIQTGARISYSAKLVVTVMRRLGCCIDLTEAGPDKAVVTFSRKGWSEPIEVSYTREDAMLAGDAKKDTYKQHPVNMLAHAAFRKAGLLYGQDLLTSLGYSHLELDMSDDLPDLNDMFPEQAAAGSLPTITPATNGASDELDSTPSDIDTSEEAQPGALPTADARTPTPTAGAAAIGEQAAPPPIGTLDRAVAEEKALGQADHQAEDLTRHDAADQRDSTTSSAEPLPGGKPPQVPEAHAGGLPWAESHPPEAAAQADQIKALLKELKYNAAEWRAWLATQGQVKLATAPAAVYGKAIEVLTRLKKIHRLRELLNDQLDDDAKITDEAWKTKVLGKRDLTNDLQLTDDDITAIYDKLWDRATPFTKNKMPNDTNAAKRVEGTPAGNG